MTRQEADQYITENKVEQEKKPAFHFVPPVGWMNDPNGFSIYQNQVHLFYQFHPYSMEWGPMHWGHAVSKDFVKWENLPVALAPDSDFDYAGCFSGTAIEQEKKHVLLYTGVTEVQADSGETLMLQNQCVAIGDGESYEKYENNPVVNGELLPKDCSRNDFRDPKVVQGSKMFSDSKMIPNKDGKYYLLAGNKDSHDVPQVVLFSSENLTDWEFVSIFAKGDTYQLGSMWECPDYFILEGKSILVLSPQFMEANEEFHNGNNVAYMIGEVDESTMTFSFDEAYSLDYGFDFYAPQTLEAIDGRRIMIGWLQSWDSTNTIPKENGWAGMMTLPRELRLENHRILQSPIRELEQYRGNEKKVETCLQGCAEFDEIKGRVLDMKVDIKGGEYTTFTVKLAADEKHEVAVIYHKNSGILEMDRTYAGWTHDTNTVRKIKLKNVLSNMRFILDKNSIELFVNDGEQVVTTALFTPLMADGIEFSTDGTVEVAIQKYDLKF